MPEPIRRPDAGIRASARGLLAAVLGGLALTLPIANAHAACTPDPPADDDEVTCSGTDSTGFDASAARNVTITTTADSILDDSGALDAAILVGDDSTVTIGEGSTVRVTEQNGSGIRGDDDNFIQNEGTIEVLAEDAHGIWIDRNTTGVLPNGAVNAASGVIEVQGDRSIAIQTGDDSGVATSGTIELLGDQTIGLLGGSRTDFAKPANVTNSGTIRVEGADSFGMRFGDGWLGGTFEDDDGNAQTPDVFVPNAAGIRNLGGTIEVEGDRSVGIFAGDETNTDADHDSFVANTGTIAVTGADAIAVSVGGNGRLDRYDVDTAPPLRLLTFENSGTLSGDADAGPLVVFRDFVAGRENRLRNNAGGSILADLTNLGDPDRGIAIRGTDGSELVVNFGTIRGDVELGGGDDRFIYGGTSTFEGSILGGTGDDDLVLAGSDAASRTFDLATIEDFESVRIFAVSPWRLENTVGFDGLIAVEASGTLEVPTPIILGGDFAVDASGTVEVTLDDATPPLTIEGASSFDGELVVRQGENLTSSDTPYRVVLANGGYSGRFANVRFPDASGTRLFTASYDDLGVLALFQEVGLLGVARSSNQRAIAQYLIDLSGSPMGNQADVQALLDELEDIANIPGVYQALSPEGYDAQTTVSVEAGRKVAALLFDRPRECRTGEVDAWKTNPRVLPCHARRLAPWVATLGSFRSREAFSGHLRYEAQMGGLVAGVDFAPLAGLDLTFAASGQRGTVDVAGGGASTLTLAELTGAAAWSMGGLRVQGAVTWGHGFHQNRRQIKFDGATDASDVNVRGVDDHESDRTLVATEIGYRIPAGPVGIEPLVGFDWAWIRQDAIREREAGGFGLAVDDRDDEVGSLRAGLRLSTVYEHEAYLGPWLEWMTGVWRPTFDVAWRQFVEGDERDLSARLRGGVDTVEDFRVQGKEDAGGAEIGLGLRLIPKDANRLRFDLRYQAYVAEHTLDQDLVGQVTLAF